MSDLLVTHLEHDGTVISAFSPENLHFTLRKGQDGPHDITYEISRAIAVEDMVGAYRTDFQLSDASTTSPVYIMAGMHTAAPQMTSDEERVQIAGKDWLHYLERRYWPYDDTAPNLYRIKPGGATATLNDPPTGYAYYLDSGSAGPPVIAALHGPRDSWNIVTDILDMVLNQPNSLDMIYPYSASGHNIENFSIDLIDTENVLSKIQALSQEHPGEFDFYCDPLTKNLTFDAPYKYPIGVVTNSALAEHIFDSSVPATGIFSIDYENIGPTATRLIGQGDNQSSTLVVVREYTPSSVVYRLLEDHASYPGIISRPSVDRLTAKQLSFGLNPVHNVSITVVPESVTNFWTRFFPGTAIWVTADLEAHVVDAAFEIVSIDGVSDLDGNMLVTFNLNQIYTPAF